MTTEQRRPSDSRRPGASRRWPRWLAVAAVAAAAGSSVYWFAVREPAASSSPSAEAPTDTAEVSIGSLAATETWDGTLGHGSPTTISAQVQGTVTRTVEPGASVDRGTTLFWIDEQPVTLLLGAIPMYRDLGPGDTGVDVEQLEANLAALGYTGFTVDDEFTWYTEAAVRDWQDDTGAAETGTVGRSSVVFAPAGGRVDAVRAEVGTAISPGSAVVDLTGTDQVASLEVEVADRDLLAVGAAVTVTLADGTEVAGTVTSSAVVEADTEADTGAAGGAAESVSAAESSTVAVEVTLATPVDDGFVGSPVDVVVPVDQRTDVLVVPVNALLALAEGGYGLEVVAADGSTAIVAVDTGLFADGLVEVSGAGVEAGDVVGVAGR